MLDTLIAFSQSPQFITLLKAGSLVIAGLIVASLTSRAVFRLMARHFSPHHCALFRRFVYWTMLSLFVASALHELGFSLGVLLGAAGVLSVAIGFASQTSASNLISGLFLVGEKPFELGDTIRVGGTTGEVLSIDLLSVKLRTGDNLFVRIPNESLIKSEVTNLTRFPIRRIDLSLAVSYSEDIGKVRELLLQVAENNPLCLNDPAPVCVLDGFTEATLNIQFSLWVKRDGVGGLRSRFLEDVKQAFVTEGIKMPITPPRA